jgi:hypothetical protein
LGGAPQDSSSRFRTSAAAGFWDGDTQTITVDLEPVADTLRPGESVTLQLVSSAGL